MCKQAALLATGSACTSDGSLLFHVGRHVSETCQASATVCFGYFPSFYGTTCHQQRMQTAMPNVNAACVPPFGKCLPRSLVRDVNSPSSIRCFPRYYLMPKFHASVGFTALLWKGAYRVPVCCQ